jgi:hypothetical protein
VIAPWHLSNRRFSLAGAVAEVCRSRHTCSRPSTGSQPCLQSASGYVRVAGASCTDREGSIPLGGVRDQAGGFLEERPKIEPVTRVVDAPHDRARAHDGGDRRGRVRRLLDAPRALGSAADRDVPTAGPDPVDLPGGAGRRRGGRSDGVGVPRHARPQHLHASLDGAARGCGRAATASDCPSSAHE